jgi:hypothetical protein
LSSGLWRDRRILGLAGAFSLSVGFLVGALAEDHGRTWVYSGLAFVLAFLCGTWKRASP